jgi:Raf kinase inhibitor-like YbhB/YbcL family protein
LLALALLTALSGCRSGAASDGGATAPAGSDTERDGRLAVLADQAPPGAKPLTVSSPDWKSGQPIPDRFSDYGGKQIPRFAWSAPPEGTKSLAMIVEDPDAPGAAEPFVHWMVLGLPASARQIGPGALPHGAFVGVNSNGAAGYFGPRPPAGDPPHHYYVEVFALDSGFPHVTNVVRNTLLAVLRKHLVAEGTFIATYQKPNG